MPSPITHIRELSDRIILLLDLYPNAAAAYSLRKLRAGYSGNAIRVRRSSDNAEKEIGFILDKGNYVLDTPSLEAFCAATNGFVVTWYDQSGSGLDVTQATANLQPQIVNTGSTILLNTKPTVYWDVVTSDKKLTSAVNFAAENSLTSCCVFANTLRTYNKVWSIGADAAGSGYWYAASVGGTAQDWVLNDSKCSCNGYGVGRPANIVSNGQLFTNGVQYITFININAGNAQYFVDSAEIAAYRVQTVGNCDTTDGLVIIGGGVNNSNQFAGEMQEVILYNSDEIASRTGIETNQNTYYNVF